MMRTASLGLLAASCVLLAGEIRAQDDWQALRTRPYPQWIRDAKLGIFVHWGVYSVPAYGGKEDYGEWFFRGLQLGDTLRTSFIHQNFGTDFTYFEFAPLFHAELFDPDEWATLFAGAGARYVVLVAKHHDGYALWPSRYAPGWNSMDVGPGRDIVGELTAAVRSAGLRMGLYYSLAEWTHPLHRWYVDAPESIGSYVDQHMIPQLRELISAYEPKLLFADGEWLNTAEQWHARELIHWYYELVGPDAVVNDRWGAGSDIGFLTPEYSAGIDVSDRPWIEVRGLGRSFGLNRNEKIYAYMTPDQLVHFFAGAVAAGGGLILNVGPSADGQIPLLQQERLIQLGEWLGVNGDAVYGSRPWVRTGETREVTLERTDPNVDFNWVRNSPGHPISEDDFTATWTGYIEPARTDAYAFDADADDGVRVWIDSRLVVDKWSVEHQPETADAVALEAGERYPVRVEYRENRLNAFIRLVWSTSDGPAEVVPKSRLSTTPDGPGGDGLNAVYRSLRRHLAYTRKDGDLFAITFEWPERELVLPIPEPPAGTRVSLLGREGALPWRYAADTLYVDLTGIPFREMPCQWAWTVRLESYDRTSYER